MSNQQRKNGKAKNKNAVKHGVFSQAIIAPGESQEELDALHDSLIEEWNVVGPSEHDTILSMRDWMWRKRRLVRHRQNELSKLVSQEGEFQKSTADLLRAWTFILADIDAVESGVMTAEAMLAKYEKDADAFNNEVPRDGFVSPALYLDALKTKINEKTIPELKRDLVDNQFKRQIDMICSETNLIRELGLDERIDATIERYIKRLAQIKTLKELVVTSRQPAVSGKATKEITLQAKKIA